MQNELLRFREDQKYILFDTETCHLNLMYDNKPWQIGYIIGQGKNIISSHCHFIYWEDLNISKRAAEVTKFNRQKYIDSAENPKDILQKFESYLLDESYLILGHNIINFDLYIYGIWSKLLGKRPNFSFVKRMYDTNALAKGIKTGIKPKQDENITLYQFSMLHMKTPGVKTNLTALGTEYKLDFDPNTLHDAANDCKLNWQVWNKIIFELDI